MATELTPQQPSKAWLAAYLYYTQSWETFLVEALRPFVEKTIAEGWAEGFFFVRYWERGPHIRLRCKGNLQTLTRILKPSLEAHFYDYFEKHPSHRPDPDWVGQLPIDQQWYPNNSVQFFVYEPETERYGGPQGVLIAEQQFEASSMAVLSVLSESGNWDYQRALGVAIQMHLAFAHAVGMDTAEASYFFSYVFKRWLPKACLQTGEKVSKNELRSRSREVCRTFETSFMAQRENLLRLFDVIWSMLAERQAFDQDWFNEWLLAMREVDDQIRRVQSIGQLVAPSLIPKAENAENTEYRLTPEQMQRWSIWESYVHMTNNRLGILNRDEAYLGYLLKEGLATLPIFRSASYPYATDWISADRN